MSGNFPTYSQFLVFQSTLEMVTEEASSSSTLERFFLQRNF